MSTQSWRTIGGTQNYSELNSMNMSNLTTETLTVRKSYIGLFAIDGYLKVYDNAYFYNYVFNYSEVYTYGNSHLCNKLYLGCNDIMYLYGTDTGIGVNTTDPSSTYHIYDENTNILILESKNDYTENYLSLNAYKNTISTGSDIDRAFINFYDTNQYLIEDSSIYSTKGNIFIDTNKNVIINSRMIISNKNVDPQHFDNEYLTVYGATNVSFDYSLYGNVFTNAEACITALGTNDDAVSFITLNTKNKQGIGIAGGTLYSNNNITFGTIGTYDVSGTYIIAQTFASSKSSEQYLNKKSTVCFNKPIPEIGNFIVDINGPLRLQMAEINIVNLSTFEFKNIKFCDTNPLYGIAIGTPIEDFNSSTVVGKFKQYIVYTVNGGITWNTSRVINANSLDDLENSVNTFYTITFQTENYIIISGSNNYIYYSTNYGYTWNKYIYYNDYINFVLEDTIQTINTTSSFIKGNVFFGGYYNIDETLPYDRGVYCYIPDTINGTMEINNSKRYKITPLSDTSNIIFTDITFGDNNNILCLANDNINSYIFDITFDFSENNFVYKETYEYTLISNETLTFYYKNNNYGSYLTGNTIYFLDRGKTWVETFFKVPNNITINHIEAIDKLNAVAVGSEGTFIYTNDGGITWNNVTVGILNAYGNSDVILNTNNNLLQIHSYDIDTYIISYVDKTYSYNLSNGQSKIYQCYIPLLFNRYNTFLLDICGSTRISGALNIIDKGYAFVDGGIYANDEIISKSSVSATGDDTNIEYIGIFGSINNPTENISKGTISIQGQNGMGQYNTWNITVGVIETEETAYNTKRLRIIDQTNNSTERMTIDQWGKIGIATSTPISTLDVSGITTISDATNTNSPNTGSLQVYGGVGIKKNLYIGGYSYTDYDSITYKDEYVYGNIYIYGNVTTTTPYTGSLLVTGGVGIDGSLSTSGNITIFNNTTTISPNTGALLVNGGAGIQGSLSTAGNITIFNDTTTISPNTGALLVNGGTGIQGSLSTAGNITVFNTTPSVSYYTGAVLIKGGMGIIGNIHVKSNIDVDEIINSKTGITVKTTQNNTDNYITAGSIEFPNEIVSQGSLCVQGQNGLGEYNTWKFQTGTIESNTTAYNTKRLRIVDETQNKERMTIDNYGYFGFGTSFPNTFMDICGITTIQDYTDTIDFSSGALRVFGGTSIGKNLYVGGYEIIGNTLDTINTYSGAFQVRGGVAIQKSMNIGGNIIINTKETSYSVNTGALQVSGGVGIQGSLYTYGNITITDNTNSSSINTGALIVKGGTGLGADLYIAGNTIQYQNQYLHGIGYFSDNIIIDGNIIINNTTQSISTNTGALIVSGGVAIQGNLSVAETCNTNNIIAKNINITGTETATDYIIEIGSISNPSTKYSQGTIKLQGQNGLDNYSTWSLCVGTIETQTSTYNTQRIRFIDNTHDKERMTIDNNGFVGINTTTPNYSLDVCGNVCIGSNENSISVNTGALQVRGGIGIMGSIYAGGNIIIDNTIYGKGVFTHLSITGTFINETTNIASSNGTGSFVTKGGIYVEKNIFMNGNIFINNYTDTTSTTQGALIVNGGVGILKNVYIGGNLVITNTTNNSITTYGSVNIHDSIFTKGNIFINSYSNSYSTTTGALIINGGIGLTGNIFLGGQIYSNNIITSSTGIEVTGTDNGTDYYLMVGSISNPDTNYTQGSIIIQGQNGLENYNRWNISVGAFEPGTSTHDTTRLRIIDSTNSQERMTIDSCGNVGINTTNPTANLHVEGDTIINGTIKTVEINTTSDYRIKKNITYLHKNDITTKHLKPVSYFNTIVNKFDVGLLAHEVQEIYPYMVNGDKDGETHQSIRYNNIIVALINDIKNLYNELDDLRTYISKISPCVK